MKRVLLTLLILLIAMQLVVAALLGTEPGSRWLIYRLAPLLPGDLQIGQINGSILDGVSVANLVYQNNELSVQLESAELAIDTSQLWQGWLHAKRLNLNGLKINLSEAVAKNQSGFPLPEKLAMPFGIAITSGKLNNLQVVRNRQLLIHLDLLKLENASARTRLEVGSLSVHQEQHMASLDHVSIELAMPYPTQGKLRWQSNMPTLTSWLGSDQLTGNATITGSLVRLSVSHHLNAPQRIDSQLEAEPFSAEHNFTSRHQWESLMISLPDQQKIELSAGELQLNSNHGVVSLESSSHLRLESIPEGQLTVSADGDWQQAKHISVNVETGGGTLELVGAARWLPDISFNLIADGGGIDPALIDPRLSGNIKVSGNLSGQRKNNQWQVIADSIHLAGLLYDRPVDATLHAAIDNNVLSLNGEAKYDSNHISIAGRINETLDLRSRLQILSSQSLHPELRGTANINLHLYGTRSQPLLDIDAVSQRAGFAQYSIENVRGHGVQLGANSENMQLSLSSDEVLYYNSSVLSGFNLQLDGSHNDHRWSWSVHQESAQLSGSAHGAMDGFSSGWNGVIDQLTLTLTDFPDWQLTDPAALSVSAHQQNLEKICLSDNRGQACTQASASAEQLSASLAIQSLPLAPFSALLGPDIYLSGEFNHRNDIRRDRDGRWHGSLHSALTEAIVTFDEGSVDYAIPLEHAELTATLEQEQVAAGFNLVMAEHGHLQASL
ncbi:MAG: hypothetical protein V2I38_17295, partial [Alcanivoracaceae bacterium]|nr:hypothetical protein [Alcanivoracaceae bacterium]